MAISKRMISIDPGTVHNGVADWVLKDGFWVCRGVREMDPEGVVDHVRSKALAGKLDAVGVESFHLRPGVTALRQAGSSFGMVEVIGALRHLCRWEGVEFLTVTPLDRATTYSRLKGAGYTFASRAQSKDDHRVSAECVGVAVQRMKISEIFPAHFKND